MNKKGQAFVWLAIMAAIFGMGLLYIMLNEAFDAVDSKLGGNFTGSQYEPTYTKLGTIWEMWPLIFLIGIIVYGIIEAMRERDTP